MKTPVLRWLIRWYQASDQPLPAWLDRVSRTDPALAAERADGEHLTAALRRLSPAADVDVSPYLKSRVMHRIALDSAPRARSLATHWVFPSAAVATVLAVGLYVASTRLAPPPASNGSPGLTAVTPSTSTGTQTPTGAPIPATLPSTWANPLDQELTRVVADAQVAVRFLATAFLPSDALPQRPAAPSSG